MAVCNPQGSAPLGTDFFIPLISVRPMVKNASKASCIAGCFHSLKVGWDFFFLLAWSLIFLDPRAGCNVKAVGGEVQHLQGLPVARSRLAS